MYLAKLLYRCTKLFDTWVHICKCTHSLSLTHTQQEEILRFLYNLLTKCPCQFALGELLWEKGIPLLVLVRGQSMSVRLLAIKVTN